MASVEHKSTSGARGCGGLFARLKSPCLLWHVELGAADSEVLLGACNFMMLAHFTVVTFSVDFHVTAEGLCAA
jgi:hypothetical protein